MRENNCDRLFRIIREAGYTEQDILTMSLDEMLEIPGVTLANIRAIRRCQKAAENGELPGIQKTDEGYIVANRLIPKPTDDTEE